MIVNISRRLTKGKHPVPRRVRHVPPLLVMLSLLPLSPQSRANAAHHLALERPPQLLFISLRGRLRPLWLNLRCVVSQRRNCSRPGRRALEALQSCSPAQGMRCRAALEHLVVRIEGCQLCKDGLWPAAAGNRVFKSAKACLARCCIKLSRLRIAKLDFCDSGGGSEIRYLFIAGSCLSPANEIAAVKRQICKRAEDEHRRLSHTV